MYASLTPPVTSGDGSRATVGRVRIRRKEIQPPRPAARRCTRLPPRLRSRKACSFDVPQTYGDADAYCMRARRNCAPTLHRRGVTIVYTDRAWIVAVSCINIFSHHVYCHQDGPVLTLNMSRGGDGPTPTGRVRARTDHRRMPDHPLHRSHAPGSDARTFRSRLFRRHRSPDQSRSCRPLGYV